MNYPLHPACAVWPQMPEDALNDLAADIRANGLLEPIVLLEDQILDGRNRALACEQAGVEPRVAAYTGDDPIGYVLSKNKNRRHISRSQLAMTVARLSKLKNGTNQFTKGGFVEATLKTRDHLAKESGLGVSTIGFAKTVINNGESNIIAMVESGAVSAKAACLALRDKTREEQTTMTKDDVVREAKAAERAYRRTEPKHKPPLKPKPPKGPPPPRLGPSHGDPEVIPGQPIQLWPARIQRLQEAAIRVNAGVAGAVASASEIDPQQFAEDVASMLAYQPIPRKGFMEDRDFAKEARKALAFVEDKLEQAIGRLVALREIYANRVKETA